MTDKFGKFYSGLESPGTSAFNIIPSENDLDTFARAIYVGGDGDLVVTLVGDSTPVTFFGVVGGSILPIRVSRVHSATTATNLIGII